MNVALELFYSTMYVNHLNLFTAVVAMKTSQPVFSTVFFKRKLCKKNFGDNRISKNKG